MTDTPAFPQLLSLIDDRSAALRDAVAAAPDLQARVPGCPAWTLRDLVAHLGRVQRFWAVVVRAAAAAPPPREAVGDTEPRGDLLQAAVASSQRDGSMDSSGSPAGYSVGGSPAQSGGRWSTVL